MKKFDLDTQDINLLKISLLSFVKRVSAGIGSTPEEVQILPEGVKLLLCCPVCFNDCNCGV